MAGAAGYVLKQIRCTDLVGAVRTVASGQSMLDARAAGELMAKRRDQSRKSDPLAGRQSRRRPRALGTLFPLRMFLSGASCVIWTSTALFWNTCRGVSACG